MTASSFSKQIPHKTVIGKAGRAAQAVMQYQKETSAY